MLRVLPSLLTASLLMPAISAVLPAETPDNRPRFRQPVAMASVGDRLLVANRKSGSISMVDVEQGIVVAEIAIGIELRDLVAVRDNCCVAVGHEAHAAILLRAEGDTLRELARVPVSRYPVRAIAIGEHAIAVTSLWSRRVTIADIENAQPSPRLRIASTIDLPIAPHCAVASTDGGRLFVADSFGGRLLVVDVKHAAVVSDHRLDAHNIRGLTLDPNSRELHVAHQVLNPYNATTHDGVFWGGVMRNVLRSVPVDELLDPDTKRLSGVNPYPLGTPSDAAGDPNAVVVTENGATLVALGGIDAVAIRQSPTDPFTRVAVGRRPVAIQLSDDEQTAFVANQFDDSVSMIDITSRGVIGTFRLGLQPDLLPADVGERLFYDARLSLDGWYSCHSCHTDGHTNGLMSDTKGDDAYGEPKRIIALGGVSDTVPWAWNGHKESMDEQIRSSLTTTMQSDRANDEIVDALKAYARTLEPAPALDRARNSVDHDRVERGRKVFMSQGCAGCHRPTLFTSTDVFDVGLHDKLGTTDFNPPSLRGVSQRSPYFHDGRAKTIDDVLIQFGHGVSEELSTDELSDLKAFLRSI